jgi:hypothetical protein
MATNKCNYFIISYIEWLNFISSGRITRSKDFYKPLTTNSATLNKKKSSNSAVDATYQNFKILLYLAPFTKFSDDGAFIIVKLKDDYNKEKYTSSISKLNNKNLFWLNIEAVDSFIPVSNRAYRLLEGDAERAKVKLGQPIFENYWTKWLEEQTAEHSERNGFFLAKALTETELKPESIADCLRPYLPYLYHQSTLPNRDNYERFELTCGYAWAKAFSLFLLIVQQDTPRPVATSDQNTSPDSKVTPADSTTQDNVSITNGSSKEAPNLSPNCLSAIVITTTESSPESSSLVTTMVNLPKSPKDYLIDPKNDSPKTKHKLKKETSEVHALEVKKTSTVETEDPADSPADSSNVAGGSPTDSSNVAGGSPTDSSNVAGGSPTDSSNVAGESPADSSNVPGESPADSSNVASESPADSSNVTSESPTAPSKPPGLDFKETSEVPINTKINNILKDLRNNFNINNPIICDSKYIDIEQQLSNILRQNYQFEIPFGSFLVVFHYVHVFSQKDEFSLDSLKKDLSYFDIDLYKKYKPLIAYFIGFNMNDISITTLYYNKFKDKFSFLLDNN